MRVYNVDSSVIAYAYSLEKPSLTLPSREKVRNFLEGNLVRVYYFAFKHLPSSVYQRLERLNISLVDKVHSISMALEALKKGEKILDEIKLEVFLNNITADDFSLLLLAWYNKETICTFNPRLLKVIKKYRKKGLEIDYLEPLRIP